ncbi:hypothetical protein ACFL6S_09330 [Candidatus Poribacteria bacterium]
MEARRFELLKFNYQNLHASCWDAHKIAWTVTGIFIPAICALQGYLIAGRDVRTPIVGAIITEGLVIFWRLVMRCLDHYNRCRVKRLRKIEDILNTEVCNDSLKQYKGLGYGMKISPTPLYDSIVILLTGVNTYFAFRSITVVVVVACAVTLLLTILEMFSKTKQEERRKRKKQREGKQEEADTSNALI